MFLREYELPEAGGIQSVPLRLNIIIVLAQFHLLSCGIKKGRKGKKGKHGISEWNMIKENYNYMNINCINM